MRLVRFLGVGVTAAVALASAWVAYAQTAGSPQSPPADSSKSTASVVLRSETRLVQLSVIAVDKRGHAVENLKKEDFVLLDNGKPQDIALFSTDSAVYPDSATATTNDANTALPPNAFGNRLRHADEPPGSVTVILFDVLNTSVGDQAYARTQILKFLQQ